MKNKLKAWAIADKKTGKLIIKARAMDEYRIFDKRKSAESDIKNAFYHIIFHPTEKVVPVEIKILK